MTPLPFVKTTESYEVGGFIRADGLNEVCRLGHHLGSIFTETGGHNHRMIRLWGPCIAAIAGLGMLFAVFL